MTAREIRDVGSIPHPQLAARSLEYLEEAGLVRRFLDGTRHPPTQTFQATTLGRKAITLVDRAFRVFEQPEPAVVASVGLAQAATVFASGNVEVHVTDKAFRGQATAEAAIPETEPALIELVT